MDNDLTYPKFLESEIGSVAPGDALFYVIPAPYEKSVSYGTGTEAAPSHILEASQQLELFDGVSVPAERGIYTAPTVDCSGSHEAALARIAAVIENAMHDGRIPVTLGGEHTVTNAAFQGLERFTGEVGIIQFDAHADLRDSYQGSPLSHACVMRRAIDAGFSSIQIGIRSLSPAEHEFRQDHPLLTCFDAVDIEKSGMDSFSVPGSFPENIYITFDVDAFDPSIMPATGTPEPGGLNWYQAMTALETICSARNVIGFDVVELAPIPGLHHPDYTVARLIFNLMGLIVRRES